MNLEKKIEEKTTFFELLTSSQINSNRISLQYSDEKQDFLNHILSLKNNLLFSDVSIQKFVLYVMSKNRRLQDNVALTVSRLIANQLSLPLIILETINFNESMACPRFHAFVVEGAFEKLESCKNYIFAPFGKQDENTELFKHLFSNASLIVSDWSPLQFEKIDVFELQAKFGNRNSKIPVLSIDDNGIVPLISHIKKEYAARFIRPKLANALANSLNELRAIEKVDKEFIFKSFSIEPELLTKAYTFISKKTAVQLSEMCTSVLKFYFPNSPPDDRFLTGGENQALELFHYFLTHHLRQYHLNRQHPDTDCTSKMSSYLRFGMIHCRTILKILSDSENRDNPSQFITDSAAHKYTDELVTWRELGLNMCRFALEEKIELNSLEILPQWARKTLEDFKPDTNEIISLEDLENSLSPNLVWNAANNELKRTGIMHNAVRMLWGKGIIRWSAGPHDALLKMEYLNHKYALDGRDSNSYVGFLWCLGKFDRPWPPARQPFGLVRSMSFDIARKKLKIDNYLKKYGTQKNEKK